MDRPKDLLNIDDLRSRGKAYEEHCLAEYKRAEDEIEAVMRSQCQGARERLSHWENELSRIQRINRALHGHAPP